MLFRINMYRLGHEKRLQAQQRVRSLALVATIVSVNAVVIGLFILTFKGADVAIKAQYVVLGILVLAILSGVIGGLLEFSPSTLGVNTSSRFTPQIGFWTVFAIYFPAATVQHRIGGSSDTLLNRAIVARHRGMWRYYGDYLRPRRAIMRPISDGVVWTGIQLRCLAQLAAHNLRRRTGMTGK